MSSPQQPAAFEATVVASAPPPGYDAPGAGRPAENESFAKTAVFSRPSPDGAPVEGGPETDPKA